MTPGFIIQVAVAISSAVSPDVGIITSPLSLMYSSPTVAFVFLMISVATSLYVV